MHATETLSFTRKEELNLNTPYPGRSDARNLKVIHILWELSLYAGWAIIIVIIEGTTQR